MVDVRIYFLLIILFTLQFSHNMFSVSAFTTIDVKLSYHIDQEWVKIWINKDGTIDLFYNLTFTVDSGSIGTLVFPLPNSFHVIYVTDALGDPLPYLDGSGPSFWFIKAAFYGIEIQFSPRVQAGSTIDVLIFTNVDQMIWEDPINPGNVGMLFIPAWWVDPEASIEDLRVEVILPEGVKENEILHGEIPYNNIQSENGYYEVYWDSRSILKGEKIELGVSFPKNYVDKYFSEFWELVIGIAILSIVIALIVGFVFIIYRKFHKIAYEKPRITIEALGPARGLTAVEAAVVVGFKPVRILTMVLFGLILKRILRILETEPLVIVEKISIPEEGYGNNRPLRYYEIDLLRGIEPDGSLNERNLARTYISLQKNVDRKMRGYSRMDTINYYRSIVEKGWVQVTRAGTPQLRGEAIETNLEWLLLDEKYQERFRGLPADVVILPHPGWYWYWSRPISRASVPLPTEAKPTPVQEFANNLVTGIEKAAGGLVKNIEEFSSRLIPPRKTTQSSRPVREARCVCACAACACACACVSCACACAGGGAR